MLWVNMSRFYSFKTILINSMCGALLLTCTNLYANDKKQQVDLIFGKLLDVLPKDSQIIALPYPENLGSYGDRTQSKLVDSQIMFGGQALHVSTVKKRNAYDAGVVLGISTEVKKGDVLYLSFFAHAVKVPEGESVITIEGVGVQQSAEPYGSIFSQSITLTDKLQSFALAGKAQKDYQAGELQVTFQIATGKQQIAFGPTFVFNLGSDVEVGSLPYLTQ